MRQPFATRCVKKEDVDQLQTEGVLPMTQSSSSGFIAVALAFAILALPIALQAQSFSEFHSLSPDEKHAYWDSMSEQERQAKRRDEQRCVPGGTRCPKRSATLFAPNGRHATKSGVLHGTRYRTRKSRQDVKPCARIGKNGERCGNP
jgi:hypothetical protein